MPLLQDLPYLPLEKIISFLDFRTKYNLVRSCKRFAKILSYGGFWAHFDVKNCTEAEMGFITIYLNPMTKLVIIRGKDVDVQLISSKFSIKMLEYNNLTVLALEKQDLRRKVDRKNPLSVSIKDFPESLKELSVRGSRINPSIFFNIETPRSKLRVLILDECDWVTRNVLVWLSSCFPNMEILSLYACLTSVHIRFKSFLSRAKNLKILDARLFSTGNFQQCFCTIGYDLQPQTMPSSLQALYLDCNGYTCWGFYYSMMTTLNIFNPRSNLTIPKSTLYIDPYDACTCNYQKYMKACQYMLGTANTNVKKLSLRNFPNSICLNDLENFKLDVLDLTNSQVSPDSVMKFQWQQPNCRVIYNNYCSCAPKTPVRVLLS